MVYTLCMPLKFINKGKQFWEVKLIPVSGWREYVISSTLCHTINDDIEYQSETGPCSLQCNTF